LLAYDITSDRRRAKIAKLMESLGERVQGSVFEAWLTGEELSKLLGKARKTLNEKEDSLRVYLLCEACRPKVQVYGQGQPTPPPATLVI
jgi:CRISPR-associated protein Cas2